MLTTKIWNRWLEFRASAIDSAIDRRLWPGDHNYQKFVVVCNIRTGSTMLGSYLGSHSRVRMFFELFHRHTESIPFGELGYRRKSHDPKIVQLRQDDPVKFLNTYVYKRHPRDIQAVGFKLLYPQGRAGDPWWNEPEFDRWWREIGYEPKFGSAKSDLWLYLKTNPDIAIVHLTRDNLLAQNLSGTHARQTGRWGVGATGGFGQKTDLKVEISPENLRQDFQANRRMIAEAEEWFADHRRLHVTYEQLVAAPRETLAKIQSFLGLEPQPLTTQTKKQVEQPLNEAIANYDELKAYFADTPWAAFFVDRE